MEEEAKEVKKAAELNAKKIKATIKKKQVTTNVSLAVEGGESSGDGMSGGALAAVIAVVVVLVAVPVILISVCCCKKRDRLMQDPEEEHTERPLKNATPDNVGFASDAATAGMVEKPKDVS